MLSQTKIRLISQFFLRRRTFLTKFLRELDITNIQRKRELPFSSILRTEFNPIEERLVTPEMRQVNLTTNANNKLYSGLTRRICMLFGSLVLITELLSWRLTEHSHSLVFSTAILAVSLLAILVGLLSGVVFSKRASAWVCSILILLFPLLEGIQAGGVDPVTLSFSVGFPVFYTLLLGPRHTILGAAAGTFLISFLGFFPLESVQLFITNEVAAPSSSLLDQKSAIQGIFAVLICAAATYTLAKQNQEMQAKLNHEAVFDDLTGIPNRRAFDRQIIDEMERARRVQTPLSMVVFDIDNFKMYNDLYGHQAGDKALQSVARAIDSVCVRSTDFVARYGGEEFVALLPSTTDDRAELLAAKIRANLRHMEDGPSENHHITLSAGIAVLNGDSRIDAEELFRQADEALYESKRAGKDCVTVYSNDKTQLHSVK